MLKEEEHSIDHGKLIFVSYQVGFCIYIIVKMIMIMIRISA